MTQNALYVFVSHYRVILGVWVVILTVVRHRLRRIGRIVIGSYLWAFTLVDHVVHAIYSHTLLLVYIKSPLMCFMYVGNLRAVLHVVCRSCHRLR